MTYLNNIVPPQVKDNNQLGEELMEKSPEPQEYDELDLDISIDDDKNIVVEQYDFYENLVERIDSGDLDELAVRLCDEVEQDRADRKDKDKRYADTIKRLGYTDAVIGGAEFEGASTVTHPMLSEMWIDFSARAIKELLPPGGCVKTKIVGKSTSLKVDISERKRKFLNYLLTEKMGYRKTLECLLAQLPLSGSQYIKLWWDNTYNEVRCTFVPIDQIYLPYSTQDFNRAERITHVIKLSNIEWDRSIKGGKYSLSHFNISGLIDDEEDEDSGFIASNDVKSLAESERDDVEGLSSGGGLYELGEGRSNSRVLYEIHTFLKLKEDKQGDGSYIPYVVTIDKDSQSVLSIRRNWEKRSPNFVPQKWFVEFNYLVFDGAYGIGLAEIMGGISNATTGATRALMDAAFASNFPPSVMLNSAKIAGQNSNVRPGEITKIDAGTGGQAPDIRTLIQPLSIAQPSPILLQMMQYYDSKAQGFQSNLMGLMDKVQGDVPVGTTLALVEESSKRYGAIFAHAHDSNHEVLKCICRILSENLDDFAVIEELDDLVVTREMFLKHHDLIPVSDPNIFSEAQRFSQLQVAMQLAGQNPQMYNMVELNKRMLQVMNIPEYEKLLAVPQISGKLNPAAENISLLRGIPIQVFTDQDHVSHIKCHLEFASSPILGFNNLLSQQKLMDMIPHLQEHLVLLYGQVFSAALDSQEQNDDVMGSEGTVEQDRTICELNSVVLEQVQQEIAPFMEQISQLQQQVQAMMEQQNQPQDPRVMMAQVAKMESERKSKQDHMKFEVDKEKTEEDRIYDAAMLQQVAMKNKNAIEIEMMKGGREAVRDTRASYAKQIEMNTKVHKEMRETMAQQHKAAEKESHLSKRGKGNY